RCDEKYLLRLDELARSIVEHGTSFTHDYSYIYLALLKSVILSEEFALRSAKQIRSRRIPLLATAVTGSTRSSTATSGSPMNLLRQFGARNRNLFAGREILQCEGVGFHFIFADDQNIFCSRFRRGLKRFLKPKAAISELDDQALASQVSGQN